MANLKNGICCILLRKKSKFCNGKSKVSDGEILRHRIWLHCPPAPPWNFTSQKSQPSCSSLQKQSYCNKISARMKSYCDFTKPVEIKKFCHHSPLKKRVSIKKIKKFIFVVVFFTCICDFSAIHYSRCRVKCFPVMIFTKTVVFMRIF